MTEKKPAVILKILREAGYEAWYVGGCVRDILLGRPVHDWDITTSALPEEVMACFSHCVPTGIRHGTVTVLYEDVQAEVTTYRTDGDYADSRHPTQVTFVRSLQEDLARRDFTVNAMAMDEMGTVVDLYGGREDLTQGVLRCVGEPERRFREDALRMLRAIRFSAQLGFTIEKETAAAMDLLGHLCAGLSAERIRDELERILLSPHPEHIGYAASLGLPEAFGLNIASDPGWLASLPCERGVRWAGLCRCCPNLDLVALRLDKVTARDAKAAGSMEPPTTRLGWKRMLAERGIPQTTLLAALCGKSLLVEEILQSGECVSLRDLAVSGNDFPQMSGRELGTHLQSLLCHVLENPSDNRREILIKIL